MTKYVVASVAEIPPNERKIVELDGRRVGVFNIDGEFFALLDHCPHAGAPLCSYGSVFGVPSAEVPGGPIEYERGRSLRCPWHQWEFDIRTGQSWYDPRNARVRKYDVEVVPGSPDAVADPDGGLQKGPYVMEDYAVSVEGDVVVVDTSRRRQGARRQSVTTPAEGESA
ncbi:Rieske (2Fe-2S) protein [Nocardia salmonicida]|uniref:Rieske (2Fe-2S) protein n=1 Tax=Nocardia salmonicida TaxID=53431 RepID=A0ABZ1N3H1_9NOCA